MTTLAHAIGETVQDLYEAERLIIITQNELHEAETLRDKLKDELESLCQQLRFGIG